MIAFPAPQTRPPLQSRTRPPASDRRGSTPDRLRALMLLTWCVSALVVCAALIARQQMYDAVKTVGRDAAPSILAAQDVRARFASMDANAALDLLGGPNGVPAARAAFEQDRQRAVDRLIDATQNITYGNAERDPIHTMQDQLGQYLQLIAETRLLHQQNPTDPAVLARYRQATDLMHTVLLPAAQSLDDVNQRHLDQAYTDNARRAAVFQGLVYASMVALLLALLATQVFITRRMRRLLNPPLGIASVLVLLAVVFVGNTFQRATYDLTVAKPDAFDSLGTLARARATIYDARGDEARWLLDPMRTPTYDQSFRDKTALVADVPITDALVATTDQRVKDVTSTAGGVIAAAHDAVPFHGYLADELNNITFVGEKAAAMNALRAYGQYLTTDGQLRALERNGRHADAVARAVGTSDTDAGGQLDHFDGALGQTIDINQRAFDAAVASGFADLSVLPFAAPIAILLVAALAFVGVQARLREYNV